MTVLFKKDWYRDGKLIAIPDYKTANKSFLHISAIYKKLGIENYNFMLCLYDMDLIGVDPHSLNDENDPQRHMRKKVMRECRRNMWYILREVIRVRSQGGTTGMYEASRGNVMMTWCFMLSLNFFVMMPRQTGKSMGASILFAAMLYIYGENITYGIFNQNARLRLANIGRIVGCRDYFPSYLRVITKNGDKTNSENLVHADRKNELLTAIAQADPIAADTGMRGLSIAGMMWDEFGLCENIKTSYEVGMSTMNAARPTAIANGAPAPSMILTTAPDPTTETGKYCCDIMKGGMPWTEKFVDLPNRETLIGLLDKNSTNNTIIGVFSHLMLGKDNVWLKKTVRENNISREMLLRDFLNIPTSMSGNPVLTEKQTAAVTQSRREVEYLQRKNYYAVYWYEKQEVVETPEFKSKVFILGMDSSNLVKSDATSFVIVDPNTGVVVGAMHFKEGLLDQLGVFIGDLLVEYPKMIFMPENKLSGQSLIDSVITVLLRNGFNPFYRIYNDIVQNMGEAWTKQIDLTDPETARIRYKKYFGFKTNATTRLELFGTTMQRTLDVAASHLRDAKIITQLTALTIRSGRVDHASGSHDDAVFALLLAFWFIFNGRNLHYYGTKPFVLKTRQELEVPKHTKEWTAYQEILSKKLYDIKRALVNTRDPSVRSGYIREHDRLIKQVDPTLLKLPDTADALYADLDTYIRPKGSQA